MPGPIIPALVSAARTLATAGRGALAAGGRGVAAAGRGVGGAARGAGSWGRQAATTTAEAVTSDLAMRNVQNFYQQARQKLGTSRPTMQQYGQVARDMRNEQERRDAESAHRESREQLMALGRSAAIVTGSFGALAIASRDYTGKALQRGDALRTFDSRIAESMARYDVGEIHRNFRTARDTGGFAAAAVDARRLRDDAWQPMSSQFENTGNLVRTAWTNSQTWLGEKLDKVGADDALRALNEGVARILDIKIREQPVNEAHQAQLRTWLRRDMSMPTNQIPGEPPQGGGGFMGVFADGLRSGITGGWF